jgi:hypothetical protein
LLAPTLKRLSMFVLRAKCKLSDASAEVPLWGVAGDASTPTSVGADAPGTMQTWSVRTLPDGARLVRLPDANAAGGLPGAALVGGSSIHRWLLAGAAGTAGAEPALIAALPPLDADAWRWLEVKSGTARIVAATVEQFVPQMVNLEVVGGVSFQKGCYPGQEVVARSQYRGTLKRRAYVVAGEQALVPGQEIFDAADPQPAGMVVLGGSYRGHHAGLVALKISAATTGAALHLGSASGPAVRLDALPYALPAAAA